MKVTYIYKSSLSLILLVCTISSFALVKLPSLVSDGMVLQRDKPIKIWGWADPGEKITTQFNGSVYATVTDSEGRWKLVLPALRAGGPYEMTIKGTNEIKLKDILIGEVWVCGGQSNMELTMSRVKETYPKEIENSENKFIRQFFVKGNWNFHEQQNMESGTWVSASPKTIYGFTALGYFFALEIFQKYKIPVGLINSSVGGTPAESWMSESALSAFPHYQKEVLFFRNQQEIDKVKTKDDAIKKSWFDNVKKQDKGYQANRWFEPTFNFSSWPQMNIPGFWQNQGLKDVSGAVWFKRTISLSEEQTTKPAYIELGNIEEQDSTYINGRFIGSTSNKYLPRKYQIPLGALKAGENTITVRVLDTEAPGGFIDGKPYQLVIDGKAIPLSGAWSYQVGVATEALRSADFTNFSYKPSVWYNTKIAPITQYQIKGVIWYQGEANVSKAKEYQTLFPALINDWRVQFKQGDFPFLFVQLANIGVVEKQPSDHALARLREAQTTTLGLKNTGMAVTHDIGEWNDIHPQNKKEVAHRLFAAAENVVYHSENATAAGPLFESAKIEGNKIVIRFSNVGSGLHVKNGENLNHFAVSGPDLNFVWAKAEIKDKNTVVVWSESMKSPKYVRYAWARNPEGANLYSKEGLPAVSFRTDGEQDR